ncbi:Maltose-binding periplasmic proteins/domains [Mycoplasmopsis citelli]|uniref:Maltose-binding periplasmic proteins/domains n=1 Tax=Mycoplasmopsis citelli TaxID=171281 RepID=A0A449B2J7_9BACT|nr:hypothetical protein [Mycoplasmopsis citelli]VEU74775.1 Maltose-binding periplasmic proteins/domains [Mycoplasmopsis citelli]
MFKKKSLLKSTFLIGTFSSIASLVACTSSAGGQTTDSKKEIIIAVDGKQKTFYDKVIELFKNTDSYKAGYRIKTISKSVWDAFNTEVGITDNSVPDIFYAPQDRVTQLAFKKAVIELDKFDPRLVDEISEIMQTNATEKQNLLEFGTVSGTATENGKTNFVKKLFGIRHNVEGIILATTKTHDEALKELNNPNTDSLEELVKAGKAIIRLQDFWYGNGILGGLFAELQQKDPELKNKNIDLMGQILYPKNAVVLSGFENKAENEYYKYFKQGVDIASRLYWPVYQAAYILTPSEFKDTPWAKNGVSQADLKSVLISNVDQVQNKIFELMKQGKIDYGIIFTGDLQVAQTAGDAKAFFNVINTVDGHQYRQALGAWSYLINLRNVGASQEKKKAISQVLKLIFSPEANYEYFKEDSKVEFTVASQNKIKEKLIEEAAETSKHYKEFYEGLGYKSHEELLKVIQPIVDLDNNKNKTPFYQYETGTNKEKPLDDKNIIKSDDWTQNSTLNNLPEVASKDIQNFNKTLKDETGLRNALAAMFGKSLTDFQFKKQDWLIKDGIVKSEVYDKYKELQDKEGWHIRKIEKEIFGANGDSSDETKKLVNKISESLKNNTLETLQKEVQDKAIKFIKEVASSPASEEVIKNAASLYFNNYVNQALWEIFIKDQVKEKEKNLPKGAKFEQIKNEVNQFLKTLSFDKLLEVLEAKKPIKDGGQGQIIFQANRIDHSNPILINHIWENWNQQTFGNVTFLQSIAQESGTKDLNWFKNKIMEQVSNRWKESTKGINSQSGSSTTINFDK